MVVTPCVLDHCKRDEEGSQGRHDHVASPVGQVEESIIERHICSPRYIIVVISFQTADTVSRPSVAPTMGITGLRDTKFQIAPMMASPAAMGQSVPAA